MHNLLLYHQVSYNAYESDDEGSNVSLDNALAMEGAGTSSSPTHQSFKHLYPENPQFVHDEDVESGDDIKFCFNMHSKS